MTYPIATRAAAARAADWLEANPAHHTTGFAVTNAKGEPLNNAQAKTATCFCAIGRLAKEAGVKSIGGNYTAIDRLLGGDDHTHAMFSRNDHNRKDGIDALREVAADRSLV